MTGKLKLVLGIILILLSIAFMYFWETNGRNILMNEEVVVTAAPLEAGAVLGSDKIKIASVPKDAVSENCLTPEDLGDYIGKTLKYGLNANSQIAVNSFISGENPVTGEMSLFEIRPSWIKNLSSSVRSGDRITIYGYMPGNPGLNLGSYYTAFVKDGSGREVVESSGTAQPEILKRTGGLYVPVEIEIAAKLSDYTKILSYVESGWTLIIVQDGVNSYE